MQKDYPILEFDPEREAILEPKRLIKPISVPEHCVISFFNDEIQKLQQNGRIEKIRKINSAMSAHFLYSMNVQGREVALFHPGIGAPLAAGLFEQVVAYGCTKFIVCGGAGVLDSNVPMGKLLVPTAAIRDEGTSYHYLPPGREVEPTRAAIQAIEATLQKHKFDFILTKTWTTDAIYRETKGKVARRKADGCLTVEMEAAALFAIARFRGVQIGQILYAGDDLGGPKWDGRGWAKQSTLRAKLIQIAAEACLAMD